MTCPLLTEDPQILVDYCADRLGAQETQAFHTHLNTCPECRQECNAQRAIWTDLDLWDAEPVSLSFNRELIARATSTQSGTGWSNIWLRFQQAMGPAASFAAAGITVVIGLVISGSPAVGPLPHHMSQGARVERIDIDQVERTLDDLSLLRGLQGEVDNGRVNRPL